MRSLETEIAVLERVVKERIKLRLVYGYLLTVNGIGQTLVLTIMLETGDIRRFAKVGNFASYCRCVGSEKLSNGKRKGSWQHEKRQQVFVVGVCGGSEFCDSL